MRTSELTIVAPLPSPEKPPAMNYAAVRSFPLTVSLKRGPLPSVAAAEAGAQCGPRQCASWATVPSGRPNSGCGLFSYLFCFYYFTDWYIDSKMYIS